MTAIESATSAVLVGVGGVCGALARYALGERIATDTADTFAVNTAGSLLLGMVLAAPVGDSLALIVATGFCGAFTTFSAFAVETVALVEADKPVQAVGNAAVTLAGAVGAVLVGAALVRAVV